MGLMVNQHLSKPLTNASEGLTITVNEDECVYAGSALKPSIVVEDDGVLIPAENYTVSYKNNTNAAAEDEEKNGKDVAPVATIKLKGNYTGTLTKKFAITPMELEEEWLTVTVPDVKIKKETDTVNAGMLKPVVKFGKKTLKKDTDYVIDFDREAGSVQKAEITLINNYVNIPCCSFS